MKRDLLAIVKPAVILIVIIIVITSGLQLYSWLQTDGIEELHDYVITAQMYHERLDDDVLADDFRLLQLSILDGPNSDLAQVRIQVMNKLLSAEGYVSTLNWIYPPAEALFIYESIMNESDLFQRSFRKLLDALSNRLQGDNDACTNLCNEADLLFNEAVVLREQNRRSLNNLLYLVKSTQGNHGAQKPDDFISQVRVYIPLNAIFLQPIEVDQSLLDSALVTQTYVWEFKGRQWAWELDIPIMLYNYYKSLPRNMDDYSAYISNPFDDIYIESIVTEIERVAKTQGFNKRESVEFAAAFVQSTPYTYDKDTTYYSDYPRYPLETLGEKTGDCEDTSILLLSIIDRMGIEAALVHFIKTAKTSGHYGVGVSGLQDTYGKHWAYNGLQYYYLETTEIGSKIGVIPGEWADIDPEIIDIKRVPFIVCNWNIEEAETESMVEIDVDNLGTAIASNMYVKIYLYSYCKESADSSSHDIIEYIKRSPRFELLAGESITVDLMLPTSAGTAYAPFVCVMQNGLIINHISPN